MVYYNGNLYVFRQDHPAGAWNENHVVSSSMSAQIELLPDQIIEYVGQQGYGKTYIQNTDPALDPNKHVTTGDYWIKKAVAKLTWAGVKENNKIWRVYLSGKWSDIYIGASEIYCRNASGEWVPVNNTDIVATAYTQIRQTQFEITQEAHRANAAEGTLNSRITQTASAITFEVTRATSAENNLSSRITQTAESITAEVQRATGAEGTLQQKTQFMMTSGLIDLQAFTSGKSGTAMGVLTKAGITIDASGKIEISALSNTAQGAINKAANITVDANGKIVLSALANDVKNAVNKAANITVDSSGKIKLSALETDAQGAINKAANIEVDSSGKIKLAALEKDAKDAINKAANIEVDSSGKIKISALETDAKGAINKAANIDVDSNGKILLTALSEGVYKEQSGIAITTSGIDISASKTLTIASGSKLTIASGGKFSLTSTYFNVAENGEILCSGGKIGGWKIGTDTLSSGEGKNKIALNNSNPDNPDQPVIYAGDEGAAAPFHVNRNGALHASSATIKGNITVDSITFTSGVTMSAANLTDGTVTYLKNEVSVRSSLDNGDSVYSSFRSLTGGSLTASYLKANNLYGQNLFVGYNNGFRSVSWRDITIGGTQYTLLGY